MNDRQLRHIISGNGKPTDGVLRPDGFDITVASEVMAVFCLARDLADLKERLSNMLVAYAKDGSPVFARDLNAQGAMAALLKDALKPNLVQTIGGTPAFVHGGPLPTSPTAATPLPPPALPCIWPTTLLPKRASAPIWARKNSATSNAVSPA